MRTAKPSGRFATRTYILVVLYRDGCREYFHRQYHNTKQAYMCGLALAHDTGGKLERVDKTAY